VRVAVSTQSITVKITHSKLVLLNMLHGPRDSVQNTVDFALTLLFSHVFAKMKTSIVLLMDNSLVAHQTQRCGCILIVTKLVDIAIPVKTLMTHVTK
jgi:hypothetical protein